LTSSDEITGELDVGVGRSRLTARMVVRDQRARQEVSPLALGTRKAWSTPLNRISRTDVIRMIKRRACSGRR